MKNLQSILSVIIEYELKKDNISMVLNQIEINYINNLIKLHPQIFNSISFEIQNICSCSNGKIDLHEIPQIIILISNIYKSHIIEESIKNIDIASIVRFTIYTILHAGILPLYNIDVDVIEKLIDSSIDLLKMNIDVKNDEQYCFNLFCIF
jgi:hypothetical protein